MLRTLRYALSLNRTFGWLHKDDIPLWTRKTVGEVTYDVIETSSPKTAA